MNYTKKLLSYLVANTLILWIASVLLPNMIVFGRLEIGMYQAILTTAFGLTIFAMLVDILMMDFSIKLQAERYVLLELVVNIGALYLLARTPLQNSVAVGITGFYVAILVGFALSVGQFIVKKFTDQKS